MLASQIKDFSNFWGSKRHSKFDLFSDRFFIDFGSVLASNLGPTWGPGRLKIGKMAPKIWEGAPQERFWIQTCVWRPFKSLLASMFYDFWMIFRTSWLTLGMFSAALAGGATPFQTHPLLTWFSLFLVRSSANFAKKIQELAEDKAENPRTCRGQSREQNPYRRLQENSNLKALFFLTPPYSKNYGRRYSPPGGLQLNKQFDVYVFDV